MNENSPLKFKNSNDCNVTPTNGSEQRPSESWSGNRSQNGNDNNGLETPDQDQNKIKRSFQLSQAPRIKSVGLPIIRSKINPAEARSLEGDSKVANSSKGQHGNVASKRKINEDFYDLREEQHVSKLPKPLIQCVVPEPPSELLNNTKKSYKNKKSRPVANGYQHESNDKKLATVIVSKGIEMKRVEATCSSSKSGVANGGHGHDGSEMKKKTTLFKEKQAENGLSKTKLKSTTGIPNSSKNQRQAKASSQVSNIQKSSAINSLSNGKALNNTKIKPVTKEVKEIKHKNLNPPSPQAIITENADPVGSVVDLGSVGAGEGNIPSVEYRTLKEFLEMPTVPLPDKKVEPEKPKALFKSKFWEYVDPNKKDSRSKSNIVEKQKNYDQSEVKSYMEKQKEIRKQKELLEFQERQKELEKKKKQLEELNKKCKTLVYKPCPKGRTIGNNPNEIPGKHAIALTSTCDKKLESNDQLSVKNGIKEKCQKLDIRNDRGLSPSKTVKVGIHQELSDEANRRASLLLKQFETIVKKECIDVFARKQIPKTASIEKLYQPNVKVDKAVETTNSLKDQPLTDSSSSSFSDFIKSHAKTVDHLSSAATKIQAVYKGYKIRKVLKEAKLLPGMKKSIADDNGSFRAFAEIEIRPHRRMSFYRTPEKPYDSRTKLKALPLSPPPRSPLSNDLHLHPYIPPPLPHNSRSSITSHPHPQVLTPLGVPPARLTRSFNEPYPREAIQRLQAASPSMSEKSSRSDILKEISIQEALTRRKSLDNFQAGSLPGASLTSFKNNRRSEHYEMPGPSMTEVLFEKLRLLAVEKAKATDKQKLTSFGSKRTKEGVAASEVPYESDFESVSSITQHSQLVNEAKSGDVSITDDYFGPSDSEIRRSSTPKSRSKMLSKLNQRKSRSKSKSKSPMLNSSVESTTTVETDAELLPTTDSKEKKKVLSASTSETQQGSSKTPLPSTISTPDMNLHNFPLPALKLQYEAEKEHLGVLEKALQATIQHDQAQNALKIGKEKIVEIAKAAADEHIKAKLAEFEKEKSLRKENVKTETGSLQLEMLKCQQEASKTTAEMAKWMQELIKSSTQDRNQKAKQENIDVVGIIYSAIDEARRMVENEQILRRQSSARFEMRDSRKVRKTVATHAVEQKDKQFQYPSETGEPTDDQISQAEVPEYTESFEKSLEETILSHLDVPKFIEASEKSSEQQISYVQPTENTKSIEKSSEQQISYVQATENTKSIEKSIEEPVSLVEVPEDLESTETSLEKQMSHVEVPENTENIEKSLEVPVSLVEVPEYLESNETSLEKQMSHVEVPEYLESTETSLEKQMSHVKMPEYLESSETSLEKQMSHVEVPEYLESSETSLEKQMSHVEVPEYIESTETSLEEQMSHVQVPECIESTETSLEKQMSHVEVPENTENIEKSLKEPVSLVEVRDKTENIEKSIEEPVSLVEVPEDLESTETLEEQMSHVQVPESVESTETSLEEQMSHVEVPESVESTETSLEKQMSHVEVPENTENIEKSLKEPVSLVEVPENTENIEKSSEEPVSLVEVPEDLESTETSLEKQMSHVDVPESVESTETSLEKQMSHVEGPEYIESTETSLEEQMSHVQVPECIESTETSLEEQMSHVEVPESVESTETSLEKQMSHVEVPENTENNEKSLEEPVSLVEVRDKTENIEKSLEEPVSLVEVPENTENIEKSLEEPVSLVEVRDKTENIEKSLEEPVSLVEVPENTENIEKSLEEPVSLVEVLEDLEFTETSLEKQMSHAEVPEYIESTEESSKTFGGDNEGENLHDSLHTVENSGQVDEMATKEVSEDEFLKLEAAKLIKEQLKIEDEIRELEALQAKNSPIAAYLSALELREKPPPPYSPPSSESLSLSSRSFFVTVEDDKLRDTVVNYVNKIWEPWCNSGQLPEIDLVNETIEDEETEDTNKNIDRMSIWATSSFDLLVNNVVQEVTKHVLKVENDPSNFVDRVRKGPLALEAQKLRIPKTKEALITAIYNQAFEIIPRDMLPEDMKANIPKRAPLKWTCRPRDIVEELLVEEMVEEEVLWTELWPEELLVNDDLYEKIIRDSVREVIRNFKVALTDE